jgi:hypothetical protein
MFVGPTVGGLVASRFGSDALWVAVFCLGLLLAAANLAAGPPGAAASRRCGAYPGRPTYGRRFMRPDAPRTCDASTDTPGTGIT